MSTKSSSRFTPVIIAISVVIGILIGTFYAKHFAGNRLGIINGSSNKLNALLRIVDDQYVDTVNMTDLVEKAMPQILAELDPHSTYIPAQNLEEVNSELEGSFSGIGIQFTIQNDTIHVNAVIQGGPSEKVGLMAGDRIVTVDDSLFVGKKVTNERAMRTLKGPKGSQVKLGIKRMGEKDLLNFNITRGDIPQNTVDAAYMVNDDIGYIKVSKFGRTTHVELLNALAQLNHKKCKGLIIDLRGNTGGYMEAAIRMVNEFLPEGKLIVYTQGRKYPRAEEFANGTGSCQKMPLVVLIDEGSASASEIFTGAIQDNDRGTVIGRRSFGKGLVQQPIDFSDGSAIRLTIARYYTPSGRCIQRPYESGKDRNYELDLYNRYEHGEFFSRDSIKQNEKERYNTSLGRTVYGGGGIMPDIFVPQDTTGVTSYLSTVIGRGLTIQFTFQYTDNNRKKLSEYETEEELLNYLRRQGLVEQFVRFADSKGVKRRNILIQKSYKLLEKNIYGNIIYNMLGLEAYLQYFNKSDSTVNKGIEILEKGEAFPKAPIAVEEEEATNKDGKKKLEEITKTYVPQDNTSSEESSESSENSDSSSQTTKKTITMKIDGTDVMSTDFEEPITDGIMHLSVGQAATDTKTLQENVKQANQMAAVLENKKKKAAAAHQAPAGGCPGTRMRQMNRRSEETAQEGENTSSAAPVTSQLSNWPVQIKLVPTRAPYFDGAELLIAADCTAFAYADFHSRFLAGRVCLIGCPKLDGVDYTGKLAEILRDNSIRSVTVLRMEVPCCGGLELAAKKALQQSGKFIPWQVVTVTLDGRLKEE